MNLIFRRRILAVLGLCVILVPFAAIPAQAQTASAPAIPAESESLIALAYRYALPVYEIARLRYRQSFDPSNPQRIPLNTLVHARMLADHTSRFVTTPNNDTLYSSANLDLRFGPVRIDVPNFTARYNSLAFMDEYTNNFAYIGRRTTGPGPGSFLVASPAWHGNPPPGVKIIHAPTPDVTLLVRILIDGPEDLDAVHRLQDEIVLTAPAPDPHEPAPIAPILDDGPNFAAVVNQALGLNPPPAEDALVLAKIAKVGIAPGAGPLSPEMEQLWRKDFPKAQAGLRSATLALQPVNGWSYAAHDIGNFGVDYDLRAAVALGGLLALTREEAIYGTAVTDSAGRALDASHRYRLHVPAHLPIDAFWSISSYEVEPDGRLYFFDNPLRRYAIGDRTSGLKRNADGSIDILVQRDPPASDQTANWLPVAPSGQGRLTLRLYQPRAEILDGRFAFPALEPLEEIR